MSVLFSDGETEEQRGSTLACGFSVLGRPEKRERAWIFCFAIHITFHESMLNVIYT